MVPPAHVSVSFIELGCTVIGLAILARVANRWAFSAIPLYLLAGLAFGNGGLMPLKVSENFIHTGAEIGVLLLLFMLGLEYTGKQLEDTLRSGFQAAILDFLLNFPPGLIAGLLLGWKPLPSVLLGGVTYISSSGVIAKILGELQRLDFPETPTVLSILVIEDLAMAVYLPLIAVLVTGEGPARMATSVIVAVVTVCAVLFLAVRYGRSFSRFVASESDEIIMLTILGTLLLVAGIAERLQVSAAIGAFLVGIAVSGPLAEQSHRLLAPLRDLFAALFFFFFGLEIDPASLISVLGLAAGLAIVTALTKVLTGYLAAKRSGLGSRERFRAGAVLVARGEFSIVIAALGVGLEPKLGPLAAAYVLFLAIAGPICARVVK
jgi:CPA2 family monovalent cation:H+ antiporter-2